MEASTLSEAERASESRLWQYQVKTESPINVLAIEAQNPTQQGETRQAQARR